MLWTRNPGAQSALNRWAGVCVMEQWPGLIVPTYFINKAVCRRIVGPCVQIYFGLAATASENPIPEFSTIWPLESALQSNAEMYEFLQAQPAAQMIGGARRWLS
jgi:hypothetical protein